TSTAAPASAAMIHHASNGAAASVKALPLIAAIIAPISLTEPLEDRRHVHLVGLVVAGQHIHDQVDAEAQRHFALRLAARHHREGRPALAVDGPGAGPIVAADDDAGDAVIDAVLHRPAP